MGGPIARPPRLTRPSAALVALVLVAGCGGSNSHTQSAAHAKPRSANPSAGGTATTPKRRVFKADPKKVAVVRAWADALRAGHIAQASRYFSLPVLVQNASPPFELKTRDAVRLFNESLPCGARYVRAIAGDKFTVVTFRLTERKGSKQGCGSGVGHLAATAFLFRHGRISEWIRVTPPEGESES